MTARVRWFLHKSDCDSVGIHDMSLTWHRMQTVLELNDCQSDTTLEIK